MKPPRNRPGRPRKVAGLRPQPVAEVRGAPAPSLETTTTDEGVPVDEVRGAPAPSLETTTTTTDEGVPVVEVRGAPAPSLETTTTTTDEGVPVVEVRGAPAPSLETTSTDEGGGSEARTSTTGPMRVLAAVVVVLALVGVAEIVYLVRDPHPTVSASRPVVTGELTHRSAVEAAARSTEQILSTSYQDYDGQVDQATEQMTDTFAEEYRKTSEGIKDQFVEQQTKLQVKAVAQGVVQASPEQVQALLFLNQYVEKVVDGEPRTDYAQYRALVTVVHTDHGWLVSDIETK
jgi:Mce-associated membrane protein